MMTVATLSQQTGQATEWLSRRNKWFSTLAGEGFTNCEVVVAHAVCLVAIMILGFVGNH